MKKVFVYGTLMKGFGNHSLLKDDSYLGTAQLDGYALYCVTPYYPGIVCRDGASVMGEVYEMDTARIKQLDKLEGEGSLYSRTQTTCTMDTGRTEDVYVYQWGGTVDEKDYVPVDFTPWHPDVLDDLNNGIGKKYFYFFAYGRYCNIREAENLLQDLSPKMKIVGVGIYNNHKLAFTRKKANGCGALDMIPSIGDHVLGVVYRMPREIFPQLDRKEGYPSCYTRKPIQVTCGDKTINTQAYFVADKHLEEVMPDDAYYATVLQGMQDRYPIPYINKYLIEHCNNKFSFGNKILPEHATYHKNRSKPLPHNMDTHLATLISQIHKHLGNNNKVVDAIQPTPEMFRILIKLVDMQYRDVLDYGYRIPRGLVNTLASEFERLTGLELDRLHG